MNYVEIKIRVPDTGDAGEILIAELAEIGFESFSQQEDLLLAYIPEKDYSEGMEFQSRLMQTLDRSMTGLKLIADRNWNEEWEKNYPPVLISNRCFIRAPFHEPDPGAEFNILIKPKMAFGTAHHETTALMVTLLLETNVEGKRVLDMGCGTGVLAILSEMKKAKTVVAIDNDEWAFRNTIENTKLNHCKNITTEQGDADSLLNYGKFDLIMANINKNILLTDMKKYTGVLVSGGSILFSGFYVDDLDQIRKTAEQNGLKHVNNISRNKWVAAVFLKQ